METNLSDLDLRKLRQLNYNNGRRMQKYGTQSVQKVGNELVKQNQLSPTLIDFQVNGELGVGSFAVVCQATTNLFRGHTTVALKFPKRVVPHDDPLVELNVLKKFQHTNVVKLLAAFYDLAPVFVLEEGITLDLYQCSERSHVGASFLVDLLSGLKWMHDARTIHCDIKPSNILIVKGTAKLSDFGSATKLSTGKSAAKLDYPKGTFCFSAIDTLKHLIVSPRSDIFALAASLFEFISGHLLMSTRHPWFTKLVRDPESQRKYYIDCIELGRVNERPRLNNEMWPAVINSKQSEQSPGWAGLRNNVTRQFLWDRVKSNTKGDWPRLLNRMLNFESNYRLALVSEVLRDPYYLRLVQTATRADNGQVNILRPKREQREVRIPLEMEHGLAYEFFYVDELLLSRKKCAQSLKEPVCQNLYPVKPVQTNESPTTRGKTIDVSNIDAIQNQLIRWKIRTLVKVPSANRKRRVRKDREVLRYKDQDGKIYYRCGLCKGLLYKQSQGVSRHKSQAHKTGKLYRCVYCDTPFTRLENMRAHMKQNRCKLKPERSSDADNSKNRMNFLETDSDFI